MDGLNEQKQSQEAYADESELVRNSMKNDPQGRRLDLNIGTKILKRKMAQKDQIEMVDHHVQLEKGMKSPRVEGAIASPIRIKDAEVEGSLEKSPMKQKVSTHSEKGNRLRPVLTVEPIEFLKETYLKSDGQLGCFTCHKCGHFISCDGNVYMYLDRAFCSTKCRSAPCDFDRPKNK